MKMQIKTNGALNFLREQQAQRQASKRAIKEQATTKTYEANEYGFYTMQQCYILNNMIAKGAKIDSNGLFTYKNKDGETKTHHITSITDYNRSLECYEQLRALGVKNVVELYEFSDTIKLLRKIGGAYFITTITGEGIQDEPYNGAKKLIEFIKVNAE